jgi:hypothetical protein
MLIKEDRDKDFISLRIKKTGDDEKKSLKIDLGKVYQECHAIQYFNVDIKELEKVVDTKVEEKLIEIKKQALSVSPEGKIIFQPDLEDSIGEKIINEIDFINRFSEKLFKESLLKIKEQRTARILLQPYKVLICFY